MSWLAHANLIRLFDFYLACMAVFSFLRRYPVYRDTLLVLVAVRGRWPKLLVRMREHKGLVLNWPTLRPGILAVGLMATQLVLSRMIFPQATLAGIDLLTPWGLLVPFVVALVPMLYVDAYFLLRVGRFDRDETVQYLDYAEKWAGPWRARMVRVVTFGRIDPLRMVEEELKKGLEQIGQTVSWSLWWVSAQVALRLAFGATVWALWATHGQ